MATLPALGFAGIGLMGLPMCRRLLAAGYPLTVWNRNPAKCAGWSRLVRGKWRHRPSCVSTPTW
ncbi:6-phosphogluconate dehydrogenase-like protein [Pseudomonas sp. URMO17WK12:I6]|nr:6-phosphogluconate dehydrogenase-like protein [Pseudomonas sp. URMO17WK12:I6]